MTPPNETFLLFLLLWEFWVPWVWHDISRWSTSDSLDRPLLAVNLLAWDSWDTLLTCELLLVVLYMYWSLWSDPGLPFPGDTAELSFSGLLPFKISLFRSSSFLLASFILLDYGGTSRLWFWGVRADGVKVFLSSKVCSFLTGGVIFIAILRWPFGLNLSS